MYAEELAGRLGMVESIGGLLIRCRLRWLRHVCLFCFSNFIREDSISQRLFFSCALSHKSPSLIAGWLGLG